MTIQEGAPRTFESIKQNMENSIKFVESRLGFIGKDFAFKDGKEVKEMLEEVKNFIASPGGEAYFHQWRDYADLFEASLESLKFKAEAAEKEYGQLNMHDNKPLAEAKEILEDLAQRAKSALEQK